MAADQTIVGTASTRGGRGNQADGGPRRRSRREDILEIAVGLFAGRGYHGVSMDDIGRAAGVTGPVWTMNDAGPASMTGNCVNIAAR